MRIDERRNALEVIYIYAISKRLASFRRPGFNGTFYLVFIDLLETYIVDCKYLPSSFTL